MLNRMSKITRRAQQEATLSMKIYKALLGDLPRIHGTSPSNPDDTPFHALTLTRQLRRASCHAGRAIDEARERLSRAAPRATPSGIRDGSQPVVLIGPAAGARSRPASAAA